ncbi:hypothetical protein ACVWZA_004346 [Sphingomonas sp. UYAg733]
MSASDQTAYNANEDITVMPEYKHSLPKNFPDSAQDSSKLIGLLKNVDGMFPYPSSCFGMDQKVQYHLELERKSPPNRKVFNRRMQEPVLSGYWNILRNFDFTAESSLFFVSLLCGKDISLRTEGMRSFDDKNNKTIFEDYDPSQSWINKIIDVRSRGYGPITEGILCYTIMIFAHPFLDGNGRFARSVLYGALARQGILRSPCLGLGAGFTLHVARVAQAATQLSQSGDWSPYLRELSSIIENCCSYAFSVRRADLNLR